MGFECLASKERPPHFRFAFFKFTRNDFYIVEPLVLVCSFGERPHPSAICVRNVYYCRLPSAASIPCLNLQFLAAELAGHFFGGAMSHQQYGKASYWDDRYTKDPEIFDWYQV